MVKGQGKAVEIYQSQWNVPIKIAVDIVCLCACALVSSSQSLHLIRSVCPRRMGPFCNHTGRRICIDSGVSMLYDRGRFYRIKLLTAASSDSPAFFILGCRGRVISVSVMLTRTI